MVTQGEHHWFLKFSCEVAGKWNSGTANKDTGKMLLQHNFQGPDYSNDKILKKQ